MDGETLKSRLLVLLQKSRKAVRLYSSYDRMSSEGSASTRATPLSSRMSSGVSSSMPSGSVLSRGLVAGTLIGSNGSKLLEEFNVELESADLKRLHWEQWQLVNLELQRELRIMLDRPSTRALASDTVALRDRFYGMWRAAEAQLRIRQQNLIDSATRGDFLKAAALARSAISLRAYEQATAAVQHEVQLVVDRYKLGDIYSPQHLSSQQVASPHTDVDPLVDLTNAQGAGTALQNKDVARISDERNIKEVSELARKLALKPSDLRPSGSNTEDAPGDVRSETFRSETLRSETLRSETLGDDSAQESASSTQRRPGGLAKVIPLRRGAA